MNNWLIRTRSMQILGPISKGKVIELFKEGKIRPDDELCTANGFWFFIRERKLVEQYLLGNEEQTFNPVAEADDVLSSSMDYKEDAFIDVDFVNSDIDEEEHNDFQLTDENEFMETKKIEAAAEFKKTKKILDDQDLKISLRANPRITEMPVETNYMEKNKAGGIFTDKVLYSISVVLIILTLLAFYYRKVIIRKFIKDSNIYHINIIPNAYASNDLLKKKIIKI